MTQDNSFENRIVTLPNVLSLLRILLVPVFVWVFSECKEAVWTAALIVAAGVTDLLDGYFARRMRMETKLGKILDPAADKICQAGMCLIMIRRHPLMLYALLFFLVKEAVVISLGYAYMRKTGIVNDARWYGKASSIVQYFAVLALLINPQISEFSATVIISICIAAHAISMILYSWFYIYGLRHPDHVPGVAMRPIDWSTMVMYLLFLASFFLLMFTSGDSYLADVLVKPLFIFLRLAAIVGTTGIPAFFLGEKMHRDRLDPERFPFKCQPWEENGAFYEKFGIKWWKNRTPDMSKYMQRAFSKQGNMSRDPQHLKKLVLEMCSAEIVHWTLILISPVFGLLIESPWGWIITFFYIISNLCSIMIQRYNRPRIQMIIKRIEKRNV